MSYRLRMTVANPGTQPRRVVIYGGTVFEVTDPFSQTQNLVATNNTSATIAPGDSQVIEIDTWCLDPSFSAPKNTPMQPTALVTTSTYVDQQDVWRDMRSRI